MKRRIRLWTILAGAAWLLCVTSYAAAAQQSAVQPGESPAAEPGPQTPSPLTPAQLDQLTAPIAVYSDPLLGMILTAATYPLQIVEAARWLDGDDHASLHGAALDEALAQQHWDTSVKALVAVPQVLRMMNRHLEWTGQLGEAFLSQQADVMDSIQRLRRRAVDSGQLRSSPQQSVATEEGDVIIEPASPEVIYVPCYSSVIYGPWPWPAYPPYYFPLPGFCYPGPVITFGIGFGIFAPYWGWGRWNWRRHRFYVIGPRLGRGPAPMRPWYHHPAPRAGAASPNLPRPRFAPGRTSGPWLGHRSLPPRAAPAPMPGAARSAAPRAPPVRPAPRSPRADHGGGGRGSGRGNGRPPH